MRRNTEAERERALADGVARQAQESAARERTVAAGAVTQAEAAAARAEEAGRERDRLAGEVQVERARLEDLRAQVEAARAEAAQLRERALTAELRNATGRPGAR